MTKKKQDAGNAKYRVQGAPGFRIRRVIGCPYARRACVIRFDQNLIEAIKEAVELLHDEFIIFLVGQRDSERRATVTGVYVPRQIVTRTSVEAEEAFDPSRFVGVAHSHHVMGAFHSDTDVQGVDNAPISLVLSSRGWCGKMAHRLPCGVWGVTSNVIITTDEDEREEASFDVLEVRKAELGDCPFANADADQLPCGLRVRRNALVDEIRAKSTTPSREFYSSLIDIWKKEGK